MADNPYEAPRAELKAPVAESGGDLASRWRRLWAAIVDGLIALIVNFPIMIATGYWGRAMEQSVSFLELAAMSALAYVLAMLINGYPLHARGQTLGKMALGIQIVSAETRALMPFTRVALRRYLPVYVISSVPVLAYLLILIDLLFIFRRDKRCVHDLIAGTIVVDYAR